MPPLFHSEAISFVRRTNFIKKTTCRNKSLFLVGDDGFEPSKLKATDLQSAPFGRSGNLPYSILSINLWSWWTDSNPRPADYKSAALPTELHQHVRCLIIVS